MASLLLLKRKIKTTQNVAKSTKAMQMIAASKLNKAQIATFASRPYVEKITGLTKNVSVKIDTDKKHPYMIKNSGKKTLLVVYSPDKGLCGAMVTNIIRKLLEFDEKNKDALYIAIGKKSQQALSIMGKQVIAAFDFGNNLPGFEQIYPVLEIIDQEFISKKVSDVKVLYTNFNSVFSQSVNVIDLLPIVIDENQDNKEKTSETLFEPSPDTILPYLLKQYAEMNLFQYFLENYLSYQAAQMIAMQNATNNANDLIKNLKLEYNKTRQEKITNEILDIGSAAIFSN